MDKLFINSDDLLKDSFQLAWNVYESGFKPDYIVGVWRGGAPIGIAVQEFLSVLGIKSDHVAIRTSHYSGINQHNQNVQVYGLNYVIRQLESEDSLLIVDDVHDTGLSIKQIIDDLKKITLLSATSNQKSLKDVKKTKSEVSTIVAENLAKKAKELKINKIYFDRGVYKYHGRVKCFADTLRKNGMEF